MAKNSNSNRGLASADEETRERVARMGGEASHKNDNQSGSDDDDKNQSKSRSRGRNR